MKKLFARLQVETGANTAEYALLLVLIALAVITAATFLGNAISDKLMDAGNEIADIPAP